MLSRNAQEALLRALKLGDDEIAALLDDEAEHDWQLPEGVQVLTAEDLASEAAIKDKAKAGFHRAGAEMLIKKMKEELGLDFEGKDERLFLEKYKEQVLAEQTLTNEQNATTRQAEAEARYLRLQEQLAEKEGALAEAETKYNELMAERERAEYDAATLKLFPEQRHNTLPDADRLLLLHAKLQRQTDAEGAAYFAYNGQRLRREGDTEDMDHAEAVAHVFAAERWVDDSTVLPSRNGRGGHSDVNGNGFRPLKMTEAKAAYSRENSGREAMGAEFQAYVNRLAKENPAFDLNG